MTLNRTRTVLLLAFAICAAPVAVAQQEAPSPVVIDGRTLWTVQTAHHGFSAASRAEDVQNTILHLARDTRRSLDDIREVNLGNETILLISRIHVMSVSDDDARLENRTRDEVFAQRRTIVVDTVRKYRSDHSFAIFVRSSLLSLAALFGAVLVIAALRYAYRRVSHWGTVQIPRRFSSSPKVAQLVRVFEGPILLAVRLSIRLVFLGAVLITLLTALSFALSQFPQTAAVAHVATDELFAVFRAVIAGILGYLPNLLVVIIVAAHAYVLVRAAYALARAIENGSLHISGFHPEWAMPTYALVKILMVLFALVVAFPYLPGGDSPALRGVSIFLGVLVSLGSGSAMGNVIAGVIITYMRPFRVGDRVRIAGTMGDVVERSLLVTRVRSIKNVEVIIPNSEVLGAHIENFSSNLDGPGLILNTTVTIGYDAPWQTVHKLLIAAALRTNCIQQEPLPFVLQTSLNDSHITYEINAYTKEPNRMAEIYSELHRNIQEEFNQASVEIMSPMYLAVRDGNTVTTPEASRPPGYTAPWFRIFTGK